MTKNQATSSLLPSLIVASAVGVCYLSFMSFRYNFDGTVFSFWLLQAINGEDLSGLWHPHHLIYGPANFAFYQIFSRAIPGAPSILSMQVFDLLSGIAGLFLFSLTATRITRDRSASLLAAIAMAFTFGYWFYSIEAEVYILHTLFLLFGFSACLWLSDPASRLPTIFRAALMGLIAAAVMLTYLPGGMFMIAAGVAVASMVAGHGPAAAGPDETPGADAGFIRQIVKALRTRPGRLAWAWATLLLGWLIPAAALYAEAFRRTPLAHELGFTPWLLGKLDPATGFVLNAHHWTVGLKSIPQFLKGMRDVFLVWPDFRDRDPVWLIGPEASALILAAALFAAGLASLPFWARSQPRTVTLLALTWLPFALFYLVWEPGNFEMKVSLLPAFWLIAAMGAAWLRQRATGIIRTAPMLAMSLTAAALIAYNGYSSILPATDPKNNQDLQQALFIRDVVEPDAVIYLSGLSGYFHGKIYIVYFGGRQTRVADWIMRPEDQALLLLESSIERDLLSRPVYALSELAEPGPVVDKLAKAHRADPKQLRSLFLNRAPSPPLRLNDRFALYRLQPLH